MKEQIIVSGFGGQGVLFVGKLLAYAGMMAGKHVSWIPSYGPEMRGGTANCSVTISEKEITSPIVNQCTTLIALNEPSLDKFIPMVINNGNILFNSSITKMSKPEDSKANWLPINVQELAEEIGSPKLMNMVMLGLFLTNTSILTFGDIKIGMEEMLGNKKPELIEMNLKAIKKGMEIIC